METKVAFEGLLKVVLANELAAGNEIRHSWRNDWPVKNAKVIFLRKPFLTPIQKDLEGISFADINDPHYWKAEYYDVKHNEMLLCGFDAGPSDFSCL